MSKQQQLRQPRQSGVAKTPVIMQLEELECGAACLAMVLAYYGKWLPLAQVRRDCGVSRDGSSAKNLLRAARNYGLNAKGYRLEPEALRDQVGFPCIIHWNFSHFMVLNGFKKDKALVNDPARGQVELSREQFDKGFTGVCLSFAPGEGFRPGGAPASIREFAKTRLRGTKAAFLFVILTTLISALTALLDPAFSRVFLDKLLAEPDSPWLTPFLIGLAALAAVQLVVGLLRAIYNLRIEGKFAVTANTEFVWHILRLPMEFFSQRLAGDVIQRQESNETVAAGLIGLLAPLLLDAVMLVLYLVVMLRYSLLLTVVGVAAIVINLFTARLISQKRIHITRVQNRENGRLQGMTVNGVNMIETIQSSGAESGYFEKWAGVQAASLAQGAKFARLNSGLAALPALVTALSNILILALGVTLTFQGGFSVGMLLAFQGFMQLFTSPVNRLINAGQQLQEMRTNMERIEDVLKYPLDRPFQPAAAPAPRPDDEVNKLSGRLELRRVSFGYSPLEPPLIEDFDLTLAPGGRVALVGPSGCGKSTLAKLISGLYAPWQGEILYDGQPLTAIPRGVFTGSVAVVDQDITVFEDSFADNIRMWDNSIEDFEVILAARDAQLHEDIMARPGGYNYVLSEGGRDLSGGQRQRLELARVLAQDPTLLILDEATSALDARTEYQVMENLRQRGISCVVVAHRLSTVRDCDEIIVLDQGRVVERGSHQQLYAAGGVYAQLIASD